MMKASEKDLILEMTLGRISEEEFHRRYPVEVSREYQIELLETAYREQNADDVEHAVLLGYAVEYSVEHVDILCRLIVAPWHMQHENIASLLQQLKAPESVNCLGQAAVVDLDYLDYDESYALAVKCAWALGAIGTEQAREQLHMLATSENPVKRDAALHQLERFGSHGTPPPDKLGNDKKSELDLSLFADQPHRWNDDITEHMSPSEQAQYLAKAAKECMDLTEHEVGYGILRELLALEPCRSSEYWRMLEECCRSLGKQEEADAAKRNARVLD